MIKRFIIFLIRRRLGLRKHQYFQFTNQKTDNVYYFGETSVIKMEESREGSKGILISYKGKLYTVMRSSVSLNWLLNDNCKIIKLAE